MAYYANFGPAYGPLLTGAGYVAIGVLPDRRARTPIGAALAAGQDADGCALWRLTIGEIELPVLYVVIDREFRPAGRSGWRLDPPWPGASSGLSEGRGELSRPVSRPPNSRYAPRPPA